LVIVQSRAVATVGLVRFADRPRYKPVLGTSEELACAICHRDATAIHVCAPPYAYPVCIKHSMLGDVGCGNIAAIDPDGTWRATSQEWTPFAPWSARWRTEPYEFDW
jgi:hypothetical protein